MTYLSVAVGSQNTFASLNWKAYIELQKQGFIQVCYKENNRNKLHVYSS